MKLIIKKSHKPEKKYDAIFDDNGHKKVVPFGATGYDDYVLTGNKMKRDRYIKRHGHHEDFNNKMSAGALSRWILWGNSTSLRENINAYKNKFNLD
jgi:hypothetical protein